MITSWCTAKRLEFSSFSYSSFRIRLRVQQTIEWVEGEGETAVYARYNSCHDFSPFIFLWPQEEEEEVAASLFFLLYQGVIGVTTNTHNTYRLFMRSSISFLFFSLFHFSVLRFALFSLSEWEARWGYRQSARLTLVVVGESEIVQHL